MGVRCGIAGKHLNIISATERLVGSRQISNPPDCRLGKAEKRKIRKKLVVRTIESLGYAVNEIEVQLSWANKGGKNVEKKKSARSKFPSAGKW